LASRACESSHRNYSAIGGRYARVFVGLARGWLAQRDSEPTADDVADHLAEISTTEAFTIPETNYEEVFEVTELLEKRKGT
ncbi:MAG TPA: short-chain dehydrogenase, partial [Mycobacterium sp.]|nr:short-chain dehydrogenase [Mycobacterium sp.]